MMSKETRLEIVRHAARWAGNMLAEVLDNHGTILSKEGQQCLRTAVSSLASFPRKG